LDERVIAYADGKKLAAEHGLDYFETSAKTNININEMMTDTLGKVFDNMFGSNSHEGGLGDGKPSIVLGPGNGRRQRSSQGEKNP
ncbi:MAG: hypothetical protein JKY17_09380, partial [Magnetovibrio sp.]|nr:hypothetical protein [Magnetovibrio sp.]